MFSSVFVRGKMTRHSELWRDDCRQRESALIIWQRPTIDGAINNLIRLKIFRRYVYTTGETHRRASVQPLTCTPTVYESSALWSGHKSRLEAKMEKLHSPCRVYPESLLNFYSLWYLHSEEKKKSEEVEEAKSLTVIRCIILWGSPSQTRRLWLCPHQHTFQMCK